MEKSVTVCTFPLAMTTKTIKIRISDFSIPRRVCASPWFFFPGLQVTSIYPCLKLNNPLRADTLKKKKSEC